jgi:hypothetical protein
MMAKPAGLPVIAGRYPDSVAADSGISAYSSVQADQMKKSLPRIPKGRAIVSTSEQTRLAGAAGNTGHPSSNEGA